MMYYTTCDFMDYNVVDTLKDQVRQEMTRFESGFLCGLLKKYKPQNIMEVGVAAGGTTSIILTAIKNYQLNSSLDSFDLNSEYYRDPSKKTGFIASNLFPDASNWTLTTGNFLPELLKNSSKKYDFIILDTVHTMPGELLDYLVLLQYAKKGSVFVLHDYNYHFHKDINLQAYSNKVLFDSIVSDKIVCEDQTRDIALPNIVACILTDDTYKYVCNTFFALSMNWGYLISKSEYEIYSRFYRKYYPENLVRLFELAYKQNIKKRQQADSSLIKMNRLLCDIYNKLLFENIDYKITPYFDKNGRCVSYPINDDGKVHYEFCIQGNKLEICLHFAREWKPRFIWRDELCKLSQLAVPLKKIDSKFHAGVAYTLDDKTEYSKAVSLMRYLINISMPLLREHKLALYY